MAPFFTFGSTHPTYARARSTHPTYARARVIAKFPASRPRVKKTGGGAVGRRGAQRDRISRRGDAEEGHESGVNWPSLRNMEATRRRGRGATRAEVRALRPAV